LGPINLYQKDETVCSLAVNIGDLSQFQSVQGQSINARLYVVYIKEDPTNYVWIVRLMGLEYTLECRKIWEEIKTNSIHRKCYWKNNLTHPIKSGSLVQF
jgi:hypothetical protein